MVAVIFEFTPADGRFADYMALVATLREDLERAEGFISLERFESLSTKGKFVSLQFWRDEEILQLMNCDSASRRWSPGRPRSGKPRRAGPPRHRPTR
jgi:quinol monooxygenase YgiN